ncbi:hypothetical protein J6590_015934 [Homalodisca vitripennis]|nr:hypothetical protein J6590_015934 [Homalodisca vitripennis]
MSQSKKPPPPPPTIRTTPIYCRIRFLHFCPSHPSKDEYPESRSLEPFFLLLFPYLEAPRAVFVGAGARHVPASTPAGRMCVGEWHACACVNACGRPPGRQVGSATFGPQRMWDAENRLHPSVCNTAASAYSTLILHGVVYFERRHQLQYIRGPDMSDVYTPALLQLQNYSSSHSRDVLLTDGLTIIQERNFTSSEKIQEKCRLPTVSASMTITQISWMTNTVIELILVNVERINHLKSADEI